MSLTTDKSPSSTSIFNMPSLVSAAEFLQGATSKVLMTARFVLDAVEAAAVKASKNLSKTLRATRIFSSLDALLNVPTFIKSAVTAVKSPKPTERTQHTWQALAVGSDIVDGVVDTVEGTRVLGLIENATLNWVEKLGTYLFPLKVVGLMRASYSFAENREFYSEMKQRFQSHNMNTCKYVIKNAARIEETLEISTDAKIRDRAREVLKEMRKNRAEGDKHAAVLIETLKGRVNRKLGLDSASITLKVAETATLGLLVYGLSNPVTLAVMGGIVASSLIHTGVSKLLLDSNPFPQEKQAVENVAKKTLIATSA